MSFDPATALLEIGKTALEKLFPDANARADQIYKLQALAQEGDLKRLEFQVSLLVEQIKTNQEQAKHKSLFVAGARPAAIWAGVVSLVWSGIAHPLLTWVWAFSEMPGDPPPIIESTILNAIVAALLGVGTMRSVDKRSGKETNTLGKG